MRTLMKVEREANAEMRKQMNILMSCTAIVMHERGKTKKQIMRLFEAAREVWRECSGTNDVSMMEMLEDETEIEMQIGDGKSWHDCAWMNAKIWDGVMPTEAQLIYIRRQQIKWVPAMVMAMMLIALKRKEKMDYDQLVEIMFSVLRQYTTT